MPQRPRHRFDELAHALRVDIQRGLIAPGTLLPTERELQESHNVSRTTVRRALADLVESGWAENLPNRGVIAKLGKPARRSSQVAFVDHQDCVHKSLFFRLHTLLARVGMSLVHVDSQEIGTIAGMELAAEQGYVAAFVWPKISFVSPGDLARIQARMPVIIVDHSFGGEPGELVMSEHLKGAQEAVGHLLDLGRQRVAITGYFTHHEDATLRFAGYVAAHHERGLMPDACNFVFSSPGGSGFEDTRLLSFRLSQPDRPDAVFVLHDMSVPAIVETIFDAGLRVPEDVAVVGFGNDLPFTIDGAGLTTVAMNWDRVAETLVDRLVYRLEHPHSAYKRSLVPTRLLVRGSCGAPDETWCSDSYEISSVTVTGRMAPRRNDPRTSIYSPSIIPREGPSAT